MAKNRKLVIVGDSSIAEVAYELFTHDSDYEVVGFAVERNYIKREELFGLPIKPFEEAESIWPAAEHDAFVAIGFNKLNRLRARLYKEAKGKGYKLASYISSKAFVWHNVTIGDNAFIFENNVIQPFVKIGDDVTLWSGNHIGHHSTIRDHVFIASHVVVSGHCDIGDYCFMGVNATVANNITIRKNCLIGAAASIFKDTEEAKIYAAQRTEPRPANALEHFGIGADE